MSIFQTGSGSNPYAPQTGQQVIEAEIIATQPQAANIAAAATSTGFVAFQCNFKGSLRGVTLTFGSTDTTIEVTNAEIRHNVNPLPASPTESQIVAQGGTDFVLPQNFGATLNPINNGQPIFDYSNAYQQGDLALNPGDVLFAKWLRASAAAAVTVCGATWRYGRNIRRMF